MDLKKEVYSKARKFKFIFFIILFFSHQSIADLRRPGLTIEQVNKPLTLLSFPIQQGLANSNFIFNLKPYVSSLQPELFYKVTNKLGSTLYGLQLKVLPKGLTQVFEGEQVCGQHFTLQPNQSCLMHFYIDKSKYISLGVAAPSVCEQSDYCSWPSIDQQFDTSVARAAGPTQLKVTSTNQNGLKYNDTQLSISGKPSRTGSYFFQVNATNGLETTATRDLQINISANPKDKPVFKKDIIIPYASPNEDYELKLMDLLEPIEGSGVDNQINFHIDTNHSHPNWLIIDQDKKVMIGHVPSSEAGLTKEITLIATSNTGGDSSPKTIKIPVAYDPTKKPIIDKNIKLTAAAGEAIRNDFRYNITDPAADGNITLTIENIEPKATWLKISSANPTEIYGLVPDEDVGINYTLTLSATTPTGGKSDNVDIPLNIAINKYKTPRFHAASPNLPKLYQGHSYEYDFVLNRDVYPDYDDIPYIIELAKDRNNPKWVRIENNKLIIDEIPNVRPQQQVFVSIKNVPGGSSDVYTLDLLIRH